MERLICLLLLLWSCMPSKSKKHSHENIVFTNGNVIDIKSKTIQKRDIYICNGRIVDEQIGKDCSPIQIDIEGKWIMPSLVDAHVHARGQSRLDGAWLTHPNDEYIETNFDEYAPNDASHIFIQSGVTTIIDVMNDETIIFPARQKHTDGADIFCSGGAFTPTEGHGTEYGLPKTSYHIVNNPKQAVSELEKIAQHKPDFIKIFYDHRGINGGSPVKDGEHGALGHAMRKDVMETLVQTSLMMNLRPYVHIGTWQDAKDVIEAGATIISHLGEASIIPSDIVQLAQKKNVYWIPTATLYQELLNFAKDKSILEDPLLKKVAKPDVIASYVNYIDKYLEADPYYKAYQDRHTGYDGQNIAALYKAGVKLLASTDAVELGIFIGWTIHRELKLFAEYGMSNWDVLASATINSGEFLGRNYGVNEGDEANLLILDASPLDDIWNPTKFNQVVHHGIVIKQKDLSPKLRSIKRSNKKM